MDQEHQNSSVIPLRMLIMKKSFKLGHTIGFIISHNDAKAFWNKIKYKIVFISFSRFVIYFSFSIIAITQAHINHHGDSVSVATMSDDKFNTSKNQDPIFV
jgi:hypothetical protein